jgi:hypothetical protein
MTVQTQAQLLAQWAGLPTITIPAYGHNIIDTLFAQTNGVLAPNIQTASYTFALTDINTWTWMNLTGTANTLTVPPNASVAFPVGQMLFGGMMGTGVTTITAGAGVTISFASGFTLALIQNQSVCLYQRAANTWVCS